MGRGHCAAPLYGFQASGTQLILGEGKRKIRWWGYIRACELGEGGGQLIRFRTGTRVARQGWPPWGWKGTGNRAKIHA